jgi:hypothetical protein
MLFNLCPPLVAKIGDNKFGFKKLFSDPDHCSLPNSWIKIRNIRIRGLQIFKVLMQMSTILIALLLN